MQRLAEGDVQVNVERAGYQLLYEGDLRLARAAAAFAAFGQGVPDPDPPPPATDEPLPGGVVNLIAARLLSGLGVALLATARDRDRMLLDLFA